jgi:hypothetical protein
VTTAVLAAEAPPATASHRAHRWRPPLTVLPLALAVAPLLVPLVAIVARHPHIDWADDRALTELAVREAARGHQLLGIGGRFGWRHPGPLWIYLLLPFYELGGRAPWALSVGALALHLVMVAVALAVAARAGGMRTASVLGALVGAYTLATGVGLWTNLWAGYAFTWPLLALVVVVAVASSDVRAGWALPAGALIGTLLVQTDLSTVVPVFLVLVAGAVLRARRWGVAHLVLAPRGRHAARAELRAGSIALIVIAAAAWIPPLVEEVQGHPGNLTLVARFAMRGAGGYPLRTALAAVGGATSVVALGPRWVLSDRLPDHLHPGPLWAVWLAVGACAVLAATAVVGWRRGRTLAGDLAALTLVGLLAAVLAVSRVEGPINFYLLTWVTVLPVPGLTAVVLVFAPAASRIDRVALAASAVVAAILVLTQGTTHDWDRRGSADVAAQTSQVAAYVGDTSGRLVRVHVLTPITWRRAAGVALQLERAGSRIEVDRSWVFLFGDAFAPRPEPPAAELWFAHDNEVPAALAVPGVVDLGAVDGVHVLAVRRPSTSGT